VTTVIVTGSRGLRATVNYHRRLGRYLVQLIGEHVTLELVLTAGEVRGLLAELTGEAQRALRNDRLKGEKA